MKRENQPIGVFDSGMGGVSVLREITACMPHENYIYIGDSANAPYGMRTVEDVRQLTISHIKNLITHHHAKAIAIACNTATSAAVAKLREMYPEIPLVGVEPAVKPAALAGNHSRVLVMATPRTLQEEKFLNLEHLYEDQAEIFPLPCPGLMEYVEQGILDGPELSRFLHNLLDPYKNRNLTAIVLGCTHYPFLKKAIAEITGPDIPLFDGGKGTARELRRRIQEAGLLRCDHTASDLTENQAKDNDHHGSITFYNTSPDTALLERSIELYKYDNPVAEQMAIIKG